MGSWFRALPAIVARSDLDAAGQKELHGRIKQLIPRLGPLAGRGTLQSQNSAGEDLATVAMLLHDLLPNLNAGEGPENTIIGFVSNGLANFAEDVRAKQLFIHRTDITPLIENAVDAVTVVSQEAREQYKTQVAPAEIFETLLERQIGAADPASPDELAKVLHEFAFNLGIDFMKREVGQATPYRQKLSIAAAQEALLPVGTALYHLIVSGQHSPVSGTDIYKLFNYIEQAVSVFEHLVKQSSS